MKADWGIKRHADSHRGLAELRADLFQSFDPLLRILNAACLRSFI